MAKKSFANELKGLDSLFSTQGQEEEFEPKPIQRKAEPTKKEVSVKKPVLEEVKEDVKVEAEKQEEIASLQPTTVRTSLDLETGMYDTVRALAYYDRVNMRDVIVEALDRLFESKGEAYIDKATKLYDRTQKVKSR